MKIIKYLGKIFKKIEIDIEIEEEITNKVIFINRGADLNISKKILSKIDAMEINGSYPFSIDKTLKLIQESKMVICPAGVWTFFCNLHGIPVVSWGNEGIGMFKNNGPYYFGNENSNVLYFSGGNTDPLLSGIHNMMEQL